MDSPGTRLLAAEWGQGEDESGLASLHTFWCVSCRAGLRNRRLDVYYRSICPVRRNHD